MSHLTRLTCNNTPEEPTAPAVTMHYENEDVNISVSADKEGIIPENATLQVVPIVSDDTETAEQYKAVEEELNKKAENEIYDIAGFLAYDISFVDEDGNKVEPNGEVKVSMEYKKAAAPEGLDAEVVKEADVTVMHLEEDAEGQVKEVVDMAEQNKVEAVETTDASEVKKAEFTTDSFSIFTITWNVDNYKQFLINLHYVDANGNPIPGYQKEQVKLNDNSAIDLSNYAKDIIGYGECSIHRDSINGTKIKYIKPAYNNSYYRIQSSLYQYAGYSNWLSSSSSGKKKGDIYFVYEVGSGVRIVDQLIENGTLTAEYNTA